MMTMANKKRNDDENKLRKDTTFGGIFLDGGEYSNCSKYKQII